ncbi:DUF2333 family protein [Oceaniserpentilla sp. 4NH20-0058]|uniref:DUF2333 family protein n=1 Tax=Oceaniserpentilla sp. 4NH20-0058 TaxID=3127660 RepID=UPI003105B606
MDKQNEHLDRFLEAGWMMRIVVGGIAVFLLLAVILGFVFSSEPEQFVVTEVAAQHAMENDRHLATGYTTTVTLMEIASTLLDKSGGYLSNDVMPPGLWLDNIPNWEFGVLVQVRDLSRALRKDFSRSQSQSTEDVDLVIAEPQFHFDNLSWALPDTEGEYRRGINKLNSYALRLADKQQAQAQFFARADNLRQWLKDVETRLGSLSQRLSASVGQKRLNVDLAGDNASSQSTENEGEFEVKTPWTEIDDVFYEARGSAWALIHILKAIEVDFADILSKKNSLVSVKQIVRELEATQAAIWSPIILNGDGFGMTANHSLVMASYISRANAGIIDLRALLSQG